MAESEESPDSKNDEEGKTEDESTTNNRQKPNKLTLEAGSLTVKAESVDDSVSELADVCSDEMEHLMQYHIRGELQVLEEEDLHSKIFGD